MHSMSPTLLRKPCAVGAGEEDLERLQAIWATDADINERQVNSSSYLQLP